MSSPISDLLIVAVAQLKKIRLPDDQVWLEAETILAHALKKDRSWLMAHANQPIPPNKKRLFLSLIKRRAKHEPLAYLLGSSEFFDQTFNIDKHVLIPRIETELLIERAQSIISQKKDRPWIMLDIGTGSGIIAVTLARLFSDARVIASDISASSLRVARTNAKKIKTKVHFVKTNLFSPTLQKLLTKHASSPILITANLPYLPMSDKKILSPSVVRYEPSHALFAKKDGLDLIEKLLTQIAMWAQRVSPLTLAILLEFDPPQAKKISGLAGHLFPHASVSIHQDACGRDRVLEIIF